MSGPKQIYKINIQQINMHATVYKAHIKMLDCVLNIHKINHIYSILNIKAIPSKVL